MSIKRHPSLCDLQDVGVVVVGLWLGADVAPRRQHVPVAAHPVERGAPADAGQTLAGGSAVAPNVAATACRNRMAVRQGFEPWVEVQAPTTV